MYGCGAGDAWAPDKSIQALSDDGVEICAEGYHICGDEIDEDMNDITTIWGLTEDMCAPDFNNCDDNVTAFDCGNNTGQFYAAIGKSSDGANCDDEGSNNVFGTILCVQ